MRRRGCGSRGSPSAPDPLRPPRAAPWRTGGPSFLALAIFLVDVLQGGRGALAPCSCPRPLLVGRPAAAGTLPRHGCIGARRDALRRTRPLEAASAASARIAHGPAPGQACRVVRPSSND